MTAKTERAKIRDRVRRLRQMTRANGCTEAEALAAAEKLAAIMRDHGLSDADIVMDEQASKARQGGTGQKAALWPVIAHCTNTDVIILRDRNGSRVAFIGREPGPQIAVYLREVCERAVDCALAAFKAGKLYRRKRTLKVRRQVATAFAGAMVARLCQRLLEIFGPTISAEERAAAGQALAERYPNNRDLPAPRREVRHVEARWAGHDAAQRVTLAHGVGGAAELARIGGPS